VALELQVAYLLQSTVRFDSGRARHRPLRQDAAPQDRDQKRDQGQAVPGYLRKRHNPPMANAIEPPNVGPFEIKRMESPDL
jgi:hypothetical protein